mmetsp:Transcript_73930/g.238978  ORF Transcript_73930/g.238978 Transcript_73930/m.238978 type:complete len:302 (-) Transcript_73930:49-954(-)
MTSEADEAANDQEGNDWWIETGDLELVRGIGEGTTSTVYLGRLRGATVAVKEIRPIQDEFDGATIQSVQRELKVLTKVQHPNILRFYGLVENKMPLRLVLEYCAGGSLFELLHNSWNVPLSWKQRLKVLMDTATAADYLHNFNPPIVHRDLKSLNLMLLEAVGHQFDNPHIKLADFGFARVQERAMTQGVGTKHWMAPEVLMGTEYTAKADVFSFAMVAYEVVCRHVPFERLDPTSVARLTRAGRRPDLEDNTIVPQKVPNGLLELITACWDQLPEARPAFAQIVEIVRSIDENTPEHYSL